MDSNFDYKIMKNLNSAKEQSQKIMSNDDFMSYDDNNTFLNMIVAQESITDAIGLTKTELSKNTDNIVNQRSLKKIEHYLKGIDYQFSNIENNNDYASMLIAKDWINNTIDIVKNLNQKSIIAEK